MKVKDKTAGCSVMSFPPFFVWWRPTDSAAGSSCKDPQKHSHSHSSSHIYLHHFCVHSTKLTHTQTLYCIFSYTYVVFRASAKGNKVERFSFSSSFLLKRGQGGEGHSILHRIQPAATQHHPWLSCHFSSLSFYWRKPAQWMFSFCTYLNLGFFSFSSFSEVRPSRLQHFAFICHQP